MSMDAPSSPDITRLPLHEAALAISERTNFTIGRVSVNYEALLHRDGTTHRGLALQEARSLGEHMVEFYRRSAWNPNQTLISGEEIKEARAGHPNQVLTTGPLLISKFEFDETADHPFRPHAWVFGATAVTTGAMRADLLSVSVTGKVFKLAGEVSDDHEGEPEESYRRSMRGLATGLITSDRLPAPKPGEPEDPNDLFFVAEMGLLRAARIALRDMAAADVIE